MGDVLYIIITSYDWGRVFVKFDNFGGSMCQVGSVLKMVGAKTEKIVCLAVHILLFFLPNFNVIFSKIVITYK